MSESTALSQADKLAMSRPSRLQNKEIVGTENIGRDDIKMPRLAAAQLTSPQLVPGDPKHIEGLVFGLMFNDGDGRIYGKGPIPFAVIRTDRPRGVQFANDGTNAIIDRNVPLNDPRMKFTDKPGQKGEKPVATLFYDFVLIMFPEDPAKRHPVALSLKGSGIKTAKDLNSKITFRQASVFEGRYTIESATKQDPKPHTVFVIKNDEWLSDEAAAFCEKMHAAFADKAVDFGADPDDPGADSEPAADAPGQKQTGIPF